MNTQALRACVVHAWYQAVGHAVTGMPALRMSVVTPVLQVVLSMELQAEKEAAKAKDVAAKG